MKLDEIHPSALIELSDVIVKLLPVICKKIMVSGLCPPTGCLQALYTS